MAAIRAPRIIGPTVVTATAISLGRVGWFVLAGGFVLVGWGFRPLVASYALRTGHAAPLTSDEAPSHEE
jgi:hypothetical protein